MLRVDMVLFLLAIIAAVPISGIIRLIKSPKYRIIYSIITGLGIEYFTFGPGKKLNFYDLETIFSLLNLLFVYGLLKLVDRKFIGWAVVVFTMTTTSIFHIRLMILNYGGWSVSVDQLLMVQTLHLINIAWDYYDGDESNKKDHMNPKALKETPKFLNILLVD